MQPGVNKATDVSFHFSDLVGKRWLVKDLEQA